MAQLQGSSLIDCFYIPDFIGSGTIMIFESTSAPTSWTKSTANNDKALRVVSGSVSNGGSSTFSTVLSPSRSLSTPSTSASQTGYQISPGPLNVSVANFVTPPISIQPAITSAAGHQHTYQYNPNVNRTNSAPQTARQVTIISSNNTGSVGQPSGSHNHTISGLSHSHAIGGQDHGHTVSESPHAHGVTFNAQPFAVYYRDVILATKD